MATKEQIERIVEKLEEAKPEEFFKCISESQAGIGAVLHLLSTETNEVTAGKISEALNISTARVAVLLKKMVAKELITKEHSATDARVTVVKLSAAGKKAIMDMQEERSQKVGLVIDVIGEEHLTEFISIANEIRSVISPPRFSF